MLTQKHDRSVKFTQAYGAGEQIFLHVLNLKEGNIIKCIVGVSSVHGNEIKSYFFEKSEASHTTFYIYSSAHCSTDDKIIFC